MKEYTIEDVISSQEPVDKDIPWKDGVVKIRILPISYGKLQLITKVRGNIPLEATTMDWEGGNKLFIECVRKLEKEDDKIVEKSFSEKELASLPPGLVVSIMREVNEILGITASIEELKK